MSGIGARPVARARGSAATASPNEVLAIVCAGIALANLDLFIVNVALPDIARDFGEAGLARLSWVLNGYAIVYAALLVPCGRVAERYPRNLSFLAGVAAFTAASAACAVAGSVPVLVAFRLVQAAGAALVTPTSLGLILSVFPLERRSGAVRTWTAIGGFAAALGPVAGGLLLTVSWRYVFLVNVPIGIAALLIGWRRLPQIPGHHVPLPRLTAAALITVGIAALAFAIVKLNDWGWRAPGVLVSGAVAVVTLAAFVAHCLRSRRPLVDPALFRIPAFARANLATVPFGIAFGGFILSIVLWEEGVWGWTALRVGLAIAPGPLMVPFTSLLVAGRLIARFGAAAVSATGLIVFAAGVLMWAILAGPQPGLAFALTCMVPSGIGVGLALPTLTAFATASLPASALATGSGVLNMARQIGFAIGVALFVAIAGSRDPSVVGMTEFRRAWWVMAAIALVGVIPLIWSRRADRSG